MSEIGDIFSGLLGQVEGIVEEPINDINDIEKGDYEGLVTTNFFNDANIADDIFLGGSASGGITAAEDEVLDAEGKANLSQGQILENSALSEAGGAIGAGVGAAFGGDGGFFGDLVSGDFDQIGGLADSNLLNLENAVDDGGLGAVSAIGKAIGAPSLLTAGINEGGDLFSSAGDLLAGEANTENVVGNELSNINNATTSSWLDSNPSGLLNEAGQFTDNGSDIFKGFGTTESNQFVAAPVSVEENGIREAGILQDFDPKPGASPTFVPYSQFAAEEAAGDYGAVAGQSGFGNLLSEDNLLEAQDQAFDTSQIATADQVAEQADAAYLSTVAPGSGSSAVVGGATGDQVNAGSDVASVYSTPASTPGQVAAANAASVPTGGAGGAAGLPSFLGGGLPGTQQAEDVGEGSITGLGSGGSDVTSDFGGNTSNVTNSTPQSVGIETVTAPGAPNVNEESLNPGTGSSSVANGAPAAPTAASASINLNGGSGGFSSSSGLDVESNGNGGYSTTPSGGFGVADNSSDNLPEGSDPIGGLISKGGASGASSGLLSGIQPYAQAAGVLGNLGAGVYGLLQGNKTPETYQQNAISQEDEQIAGDEKNEGEMLLGEYNSGQLPPGEGGVVSNDVNAAVAQIKSQYAALGLSGSTMEAQAIQGAQTQGANETATLLQNLLGEGNSFLNSSTGALGGAAAGYADIAQAETADDNELQSSLGDFAKSLGLLSGTGGTPQDKSNGVNINL